MFAYTSVFNQSSGPQARLLGVASTNAAQTYVRNGAPVTTTSVLGPYGTSTGNFNTAASATSVSTTSPAPSWYPKFGEDFTIECWISFNPSLPTTARELVSGRSLANSTMGFRYGKAQNSVGADINYISLYASGTTTTTNQNYAPYTFTANTWHFLVAQRQGTTISFWGAPAGSASAPYLGGNLFTTNDAGNFVYNQATTFFVGGFQASSAGPRCFFNEVTVSNVARYSNATAAIAMPTGFMPVDQYCVQEMRFQGVNGGTSFPNTTS